MQPDTSKIGTEELREIRGQAFDRACHLGGLYFAFAQSLVGAGDQREAWENFYYEFQTEAQVQARVASCASQIRERLIQEKSWQFWGAWIARQPTIPDDAGRGEVRRDG